MDQAPPIVDDPTLGSSPYPEKEVPT